jgi:CBS domain containing-hemolysin-like protein
MEPAVILTIVLKLLAVALLVLINGFFVAAEFAIVKIRHSELDALIAKGNRRARVARQVVQNLNSSLSAAQLGITLASLGLGWIGEPVFSSLLAPVLSWLRIESVELRHSISFMVGFSAITFLHISAGEQAPKALAIQKSLATSLWIASPLTWFHRLSYPFIWILNTTSLWMLRQLGIEPASEAEQTHSEDELRLIISATGGKSASPVLGRNLVLNALDLRHRVVREVMRPRQEIITLNTEASISECIALAERTRFSRFPICEMGDLDKTLCTVHIKDIYALRLRAHCGRDLTIAGRKIIYVPETARLEKLLQFFLTRKLHMAMVVDEYGGTCGMATLENILEELVGPIQDEFDQEQPLYRPLGQEIWEIHGSLPLRELSLLTLETITDEGVATTSGLVTQRLGGFARTGDTLVLGSFDLRVEEMDGPKIARLKLSRRPTNANPEPGDNAPSI